MQTYTQENEYQMKTIVEGLQSFHAQCAAEGGTLLGGLTAILVEGARYINDTWRIAKGEFKALKDRVKILEEQGPADSSHTTTSASPVNPPSAHDLVLAGADLGSNGGALGPFSSSYAVANAVNTTGIGATSTAALVNVSTGDRQLVRSHVVSFNAVGTPGTPSISSPLRLGTVTFPLPFDRPPKVRLTPLSADAGGLNVHVNLYSNGQGYDIVADGGTIATAKSYQYAVTVEPN